MTSDYEDSFGCINLYGRHIQKGVCYYEVGKGTTVNG